MKKIEALASAELCIAQYTLVYGSNKTGTEGTGKLIFTFATKRINKKTNSLAA